MKAFFVVAAAACWLMCGAAAIAQKSVEDEAKSQFDAGVSLFERGQFEKAAVAFARAYELRPSYKILYLVGKCENELGHSTAALDAFTRYLSEGGEQIEKARRDEVQKEISQLNALVGSVVVETDAEGATVFVDERRMGETPLSGPLYVDLGEHTVMLKRGVAELHREVVKVAGGQRVTVKVELGADTEAKTVKAETSEEAAKPEEASSKPKRVWTWVAVGVGGAAAIGAAVTGGVSLSKTNDIKDDCDGNTCPGSLKSEGDTARALGNASTALIAVAGVGVAAGVVLFFLEPKWNKSEGEVEVAPVVAPTANGGALALVGRF